MGTGGCRSDGSNAQRRQHTSNKQPAQTKCYCDIWNVSGEITCHVRWQHKLIPSWQVAARLPISLSISRSFCVLLLSIQIIIKECNIGSELTGSRASEADNVWVKCHFKFIYYWRTHATDQYWQCRVSKIECEQSNNATARILNNGEKKKIEYKINRFELRLLLLLLLLHPRASHLTSILFHKVTNFRTFNSLSIGSALPNT